MGEGPKSWQLIALPHELLKRNVDEFGKLMRGRCGLAHRADEDTSCPRSGGLDAHVRTNRDAVTLAGIRPIVRGKQIRRAGREPNGAGDMPHKVERNIAPGENGSQALKRRAREEAAELWSCGSWSGGQPARTHLASACTTLTGHEA